MIAEQQPPTEQALTAAQADLAAAPELEVRLARLEFAEALGRRQLTEQPDLFESQLVGRWESLDELVKCYIVEAGMAEQLDRVAPGVQRLPDRADIVAELRRDLLVVPVAGAVWVFDPRPPLRPEDPALPVAVGHAAKLAVVNSTSDSSDTWAYD